MAETQTELWTISTDTARKNHLLDRFANQSITLNEYIELACWNHSKKTDTVLDLDNKAKRSFQAEAETLRNKFLKAGFKGDTPWSKIANSDGVTQLLSAETTKMSDINKFQRVEKSAQSFYNNNKTDARPLTSYLRITGTEGLARSEDIQGLLVGEAAEKASQYRRSLKFEYVPEAQKTFEAILHVMQRVPDDEVRTALALNLFLPYRPYEIHELKVKDIQFELGRILKNDTNPNKIRQGIQFPEIIKALLEDAAKGKGPEDELFPNVTTQKMTNALDAGGIQEAFHPYRELMGRTKVDKDGKPEKIIKGVSDFRKLIPSLLAYELGGDASVVSVIMGHDDIGSILKEVTKRHYVSPVAVQGSAADDFRALAVLQSMIARNVDAKTLNQVPSILGFSATGLTAEGAMQLVVPDAIREGHVTPFELGRELSQAELDEIDSRALLNTSQNELAAAETTGKTLDKQLENLDKEQELYDKRKATRERQLTPEYASEKLDIEQHRGKVAALTDTQAELELNALNEKKAQLGNLTIEDEQRLQFLQERQVKPSPKPVNIPTNIEDEIRRMRTSARRILGVERYDPVNLTTHGLFEAAEVNSPEGQKLKAQLSHFIQTHDAIAEGNPKALKGEQLLEQGYYAWRREAFNSLHNDPERVAKVTTQLSQKYGVKARQVFNGLGIAGVVLAGAITTDALLNSALANERTYNKKRPYLSPMERREWETSINEQRDLAWALGAGEIGNYTFKGLSDWVLDYRRGQSEEVARSTPEFLRWQKGKGQEARLDVDRQMRGMQEARQIDRQFMTRSERPSVLAQEREATEERSRLMGEFRAKEKEVLDPLIEKDIAQRRTYGPQYDEFKELGLEEFQKKQLKRDWRAEQKSVDQMDKLMRQYTGAVN